MNALQFAEIYHERICTGGPKQPSPRKPPVKNTFIDGYNAGWNAAVEHFKAVGKI